MSSRRVLCRALTCHQTETRTIREQKVSIFSKAFPNWGFRTGFRPATVPRNNIECSEGKLVYICSQRTCIIPDRR